MLRPSNPRRFFDAACIALALALVLLATPTRAQCPDPVLGPEEVIPAVGARDVTTDAYVVVRYGAGYFGPEGPGDDPNTLFSLERCGECGVACDVAAPVRGHVEVLADELFFVPDAPLGSRTQYRGVATGLEGSLNVSFCTGDGPDRGPAEFNQVVRFDPIPNEDPCMLPGGGYRVGVYAPSANDDGPGGSLEYLLFLTRASGLEAPVLVDRFRNLSAGEITMYLLLDRARAASSVCVRLGVVDGVGHVTMGDEDFCFDPVARIAFQGCAAGGTSGSTRSTLPVTLAPWLGVVFALGVRRARRTR